MNYYTILGLNKNSSKEEIKRAYKILALKYHPDKNNGDDLIFKNINEAYQILINDEKRYIYDLNLEKEEDSLINLFSDIFTTFVDIIKTKFNKTKNCTIINVKISLDEIYEGLVKKLIIKIKNKEKIEYKKIYINFLDLKPEYKYEKEGDNGNDLIIKVNINKPDNIFYLNKHDLLMIEKISLNEYFNGIKRNIKYLGNEDIYIDINLRDKEKMYCKIQDRGLPYLKDNVLFYGYLLIYFKIEN